MFILDTNVVSELRKASTGKADRGVVAWANSVPVASLFLSAITILELEMGVLQVERRDALLRQPPALDQRLRRRPIVAGQMTARQRQCRQRNHDHREQRSKCCCG